MKDSKDFKMNKREGFWIDPNTMKMVAGYFESDSNLHYGEISPNGSLMMYKSNANIPTRLYPIRFEDGLRVILQQLNNKHRHNWELYKKNRGLKTTYRPICPDCHQLMVKSWLDCEDGSGCVCTWLCGCKESEGEK